MDLPPESSVFSPGLGHDCGMPNEGLACSDNNATRGRAMTEVNRQILLARKPSDKLGKEHFRLVEAAIPEPKDGEARLAASSEM